MSKKHFEALAQKIAETPALQTREVVIALARFCESQNARFDVRQWLAFVESLVTLK